MSVQEVLSGERRHWCERADALDFLRALPDDSVDLLFTSPPYEKCRTYGLGDKMVGGEAWVKWMFEVVTAAAPKVKGLIAINCEGQTRGYRYSCVPFLLMADLHRAGFNLRKPAVYERDGIPGSGGPDWLKNRWEPIVCLTRPGRLPWSDNTAYGWKPVPATRGLMTNRKTDGRKDGGEYIDPDLCNPGNVIDCGSAAHLGHDFAHESEAPFPLKLPMFFVKSFAPPDGIVCDPFSGSGTTCQAAYENNRRFVGADIRQSQVDLYRRRMATVTPDLAFA